MRKYKTTGNTTLFDAEEKERKLTEMGAPPVLPNLQFGSREASICNAG